MRSEIFLPENYFNTSPLTIHTQCVSVEESFRFSSLQALNVSIMNRSLSQFKATRELGAHKRRGL